MARGSSLTPNTNFVGSNFWSVNTYLMSLNLRKAEIGGIALFLLNLFNVHSP